MSRTCSRCRGSGIEDYRVHGISHDGEACIEHLKCRECDGFGTVENPPMAQSVAERQRAFKASMKDAGFVKMEAWVTKKQRDKFRQLGGDEWLRKKIDAAKQKPTNGS